MIKRIFYFTIAIIILLAIFYPLNHYLININKIAIPYSLRNVYLFHSISAIIIYSLVELIAENVPSQAGYGYLASIFLKMGFFVLIFQSDVFPEEILSKSQRISLVIPLFIFLSSEAFAVYKLLNTKEF